MNFKSPPQTIKSSLTTNNRKNPLFYSVSKPNSKQQSFFHENYKEEDKFHEFKKNLLEELKVLKEANNMMRERNKFLVTKSPNESNTSWMSDIFEKQQQKKTEPVSHASPKPKLFENYIDKPLKYEIARNIYSSKEIPQKNTKTENLDHALDVINTVLNFDIRDFIKDLKEASKGKLSLKEIMKVDLTKYCGDQCKLEFIIDREKINEVEKISIKKRNIESQTEQENPYTILDKKNDEEQKKNICEEKKEKSEEGNLYLEEAVNFCLDDLYSQAIKQVAIKKKKQKKVLINEKIPLQEKKKKVLEEKKLANNYLLDLYDEVCIQVSSKSKMEKKDTLGYFSAFKRDGENYDRLDKIVDTTLKEMHENLLWVYCKTKFSIQF